MASIIRNYLDRLLTSISIDVNILEGFLYVFYFYLHIYSSFLEAEIAFFLCSTFTHWQVV